MAESVNIFGSRPIGRSLADLGSPGLPPDAEELVTPDAYGRARAVPKAIAKPVRSLADLTGPRPTQPDPGEKLLQSEIFSQDIKPDVAARIIKVENKSGLPRKFIEDNLDELERATALQSFSAANYRERSPKLAEWLAGDPARQSVMRKDRQIFSFFEDRFRGFMTGWERAGSRWLELEQKERGGQILTPAEEKELKSAKQRLASLSQQEEFYGPAAFAMSETAYAARQSLAGLYAAAQGAGWGVTAAAGLGSLLRVPVGPSLLAGGKIGGLMGVTMHAYNLESASAYSEFKDLRDVYGNPLVDRRMAAQVAGYVGAVNAAIEAGSTVLLGGIAKTLFPSVNRLIDNMGKDAAKGYVMAQTKALLANPTRLAAVMGGLKKTGMMSLIEGGEEFVQALVQAGGREVVQAKSGQEFKPDSIVDDVKGALKQAGAAWVGSFFLGLPFGSLSAARHYRAATRAEQTQEFFRGLAETASNAETIKASPEAARGAFEAMKAGGDVQNVYVPVSAWNALFQADARQVASDVLGDTKQYDEANALSAGAERGTGADLVIPVEVYAEKLAGTPFHEQIADDARVGLGDLSARELQEIDQNYVEIVSAALEESEAQKQSLEERESVLDASKQKFEAIMGKEAALDAAESEVARYEARAERLGMKLSELYAAESVAVKRAMQPPAQAEQMMQAQREAQIRSPEFKEWLGDSVVTDNGKPISEGGMPLEVYHGTGEVGITSFNVPAWFSVDASLASQYAGAKSWSTGRRPTSYPVYLRITNPLRVDINANEMISASALRRATGVDFQEIAYAGISSEVSEAGTEQLWKAHQLINSPEFIKAAIALGFDGIRVREGRHMTFAIFSPAQAKSAIGNRGTFDPESGNILYQSSESLAEERNAREIARYVSAADMWRDLAMSDDLFQYPRVAARELADIAAQIDVRLRLTPKLRETDKQGVVTYQSWQIQMPGGEVATITHNKGEVYIDVAGLRSGKSLGSSIYQIASTYAHNNGLVFVGDPHGITDKGKQRRVEHMLSSALKFNTTAHIRPHKNMYLPWRDGDDQFNIASMVRRSYEQTVLDVPEADMIVYNQEDQRFETLAGKPVSDKTIAALATKRSAGGRAAVGSATIKRAILVNTVLRQEREEGEGARPGLLAGVGQPTDVGGRQLPQGLARIAYQAGPKSRKIYRGAFQGFEAGSYPTITLFRAANPSTIIHELGHSWVEELRRDAAYAAEQISAGATENRENFENLVSDWETIKRYLRIENIRDDEVIPVEAHERFARSAEAYFLEGKAPSLQLRRAFSNFARWMVRIYKSIRGLDVEMTDEVRGVFDRLLATDEQIAEAQQSAAKDAISLPLDKITTEEARALAQLMDGAKLEAEESVRSELFNEYARSTKAWFRHEVARLSGEVEQEIAKQPVYRVVSWLKTGKLPNGDELPGYVHQQMSAEALRQMGYDPKRMPAWSYQAKGGINPTELADTFGFVDAATMIREMGEAPTLQQAVKAEVDQIMQDNYGDMLADGSIGAKAAAAVHGSRRADVLLAEMRILNRLGAPGKPPVKQMMIDLAKRMVADRKLKDVNPKQYEIAGARASRDAMKAAVRGQYDKAFAAKVRELMNLYMHQEASKQREIVDKSIRAWRMLGRSDERLAKSRDINLVNVARAILGNYGIGGYEQDAREYIAMVEQYDQQLAADLTDMVESATPDRKAFSDMTGEEFAQMRQVVDGIWQLSSLAKTIEIDGKRKSLKSAIDETLAQAEKVSSGPRNVGRYQAPSEREKLGLKFLNMRAALRRVEHWVDAMDSGNPDGPFRKHVWQPVSEAADRYRAARVKTLEEYLKIAKMLEGRLSHKEEFDGADTIGYKFTSRSELLGALLHTGNESNLRKLLIGGRGGQNRWGSLREDGTLDRSRWDAFIQKMHDSGKITKQDWDYVQAVWNLMESLKPAAQEAHRKIYGYYFKEVSAQQFVTPFGTYQGGYYPAIRDPMLVSATRAEQEQEIITSIPNGFMFPTTGRGFTKSRIETYFKPLHLDMGLISLHIDKVLRFTHLEPAVRDVGRLVFNQRFSEAMAETIDPAVVEGMLRPWLQRAATQSVETPSPHFRALDRVFRGLRTRSSAAIMIANVVNTLQQFTGIASAALVVRPGYLRESLFEYISHPKDTAAEIAEKSSFMQHRTAASAFEIQRSIDDIMLDPSKYQKAKSFAMRHGYFMQQATQSVVDIVVWRGAYNQSIAKGADEQGAIRQADSAVRMTQGTFAAEDLSKIETGSAGMRMFTMFYSYFNTQANLVGSAFVKQIRETGFSAPGKLFYIYMMGVMVPSVVAEAIAQVLRGEVFDDDDDEWYLKSLLDIFFLGQARFLAAAVPFGGQVVTAAINTANDKWFDDRISTSPAISMLEAAGRTFVQHPYRAISEDKELNVRMATRDLLTTMQLFTGLPFGALARPAGYAAGVLEGRYEPINEADLVRGLITGRAIQQ